MIELLKFCENCGGRLHRANQTGFCSKNPECQSMRQAVYRILHPPSTHPATVASRDWASRNPVSRAITNSKQVAKRHGLPHNLTLENIPPVPPSCPCCGEWMRHGADWKHTPSLDKLVPSMGYVVGNVAWICRQCNRIKDNATVDQLRQVANYIEGALAA